MSFCGGVGWMRAPTSLCCAGNGVNRELWRGNPIRPGHDPRGAELQPAASDSKYIVENLWRGFFSDPSQWWDHRAEKDSPRYPDFRHKETSAGLWVNSKLNPSWVEAELGTMSSSNLQEHVFSWNKRLARYVKDGQYEKALEIFHQMQAADICPDKFTFITIVKACARIQALREGKRIHCQIIHGGYASDMYLSSGLIDMYARCGRIEDAKKVFDDMTARDVVSWNAIILGYAKCGQGQMALELFRKMQLEGVDPDPVTYVGFLNACAGIAALEEGRYVHEQIIQRGWDSGVFIGSSLIGMYAACGKIDDARMVFDKIFVRDVACWNAMIQGYVKCAQGQRALDLTRPMQQEGVEPNTATFVGLLNACASVKDLAEGTHLHEQVVQRGLVSELIICTSIVHMYSECGRIGDAWAAFNRMPDARRLFNKIPLGTVSCWNAMIEGFVKCGHQQRALDLYWAMMRENVEPDRNTFVAALNACGSLGARREGRRVHESITRRGLASLPCMGACLIRMYTGCGKIAYAWTVFNGLPVRDLGCWNAMLQGSVACGQGEEALDLYERMRLENVEPDVCTFVEALNACGMVGALERGKRVHEQICALGLETDRSLSRTLTRMYAKCERLIKERTVYSKLPRHDQITLLTVVQE